jgi:hypothetical protein
MNIIIELGSSSQKMSQVGLHNQGCGVSHNGRLTFYQNAKILCQLTLLWAPACTVPYQKDLAQVNQGN